MQQRLLNFFRLVRVHNPKLRWTFYLTTITGDVWTEANLSDRGMPPVWVIWINATADFPYQTGPTSGYFTTYRVIPPRRAAWNLVRTAQDVYDDVSREFDQRRRGINC
jgi:hypothetical protein